MTTGLTTAIGVISGTSMDGIDVSMVETDGMDRVEAGAGRVYPYAPSLRSELAALIRDPDGAAAATIDALECEVSDAHAHAVLAFMRDEEIAPDNVSLVGMHGQTVAHRPDRRYTRQLGLGQRAAAIIGIDVVNRFRHADVEAGGHGAPLVPLYHRALARGFAQPLVILNLGGVANITYLDGDTVIAFDTGPASALLDDLMLRATGESFDRDGRFAASGSVSGGMLDSLMQNAFFGKAPPKSLDRQDFHKRTRILDVLPDRDAAATLLAFTVASIAKSLDHLPNTPLRWLVGGGGRLNAALMDGLRHRLAVPVEAVETVGWDGDYLEAQCFAYLSVRSRKGLPLSLPSTTGVPHPMPGGELWRAA